MRDRVVSVDLQPDGRYLIETYSRTVDLARVMDGAPQILPAGATAQELGESVLVGLNRSHHQMPKRSTIARPDADFLNALGLSSFSKYMPAVRSVNIYSEFDQVDDTTEFLITPYHNEGPRGGFIGLDDLARTVPYQTPEQLGQAVLDALEQATA